MLLLVPQIICHVMIFTCECSLVLSYYRHLHLLTGSCLWGIWNLHLFVLMAIYRTALIRYDIHQRLVDRLPLFNTWLRCIYTLVGMVHSIISILNTLLNQSNSNWLVVFLDSTRKLLLNILLFLTHQTSTCLKTSPDFPSLLDLLSNFIFIDTFGNVLGAL